MAPPRYFPNAVAGSMSTPPPVYRPFSAMSAQRKVVTAPPVYNPAKSLAQKNLTPAPPPAYRPAPSAGIQRKAMTAPPAYVPFNQTAAQKKALPTPPPVYRPGGASTAQGKISPETRAVGFNALSPKSPSHWPQRRPVAAIERAPALAAAKYLPGAIKPAPPVPPTALRTVQLKPSPAPAVQPVAARSSTQPARPNLSHTQWPICRDGGAAHARKKS